MYTGHGFNQWGLGDLDVVRLGGEYHLFHLVLPNHAYIAHAVSDDGVHWRRVKNALFLGDPGEWDDDMLWTMHVTPDPDREGGWRMFYTGLARVERGRIQRIGLAVSDDLITWRKVRGGFPLEIDGRFYESGLDEGRHWVSFRDPFFCQVDGQRWLLAAARVKGGPVIRRGCVALAREDGPDRFTFRPPLHWPRLYDDIEVPNLVHLGERFYLIGSIREDVKVHYWYAEAFDGPYLNFSDNVLLPRGNYAARICHDGDRVLVWNFFSPPAQLMRGLNQMLPPPKELVVGEGGELSLRSFRGFDRHVLQRLDAPDLMPLRRLHQTPGARADEGPSLCHFGSDSAMEVFLVPGRYESFRFRGRLAVKGRGKCGFVLRADDEGNGYHVSLDVYKGLIQIRAWGASGSDRFEEAFRYDSLQANYFLADRRGVFDFELVAFGRYLEVSLDGRVLLTLADDTYQDGGVGFYTESATLCVEDLTLEVLDGPRHEVCVPMR
jgi:beta-fructofuranosidase